MLRKYRVEVQDDRICVCMTNGVLTVRSEMPTGDPTVYEDCLEAMLEDAYNAGWRDHVNSGGINVG